MKVLEFPVVFSSVYALHLRRILTVTWDFVSIRHRVQEALSSPHAHLSSLSTVVLRLFWKRENDPEVEMEKNVLPTIIDFIKPEGNNK